VAATDITLSAIPPIALFLTVPQKTSPRPEERMHDWPRIIRLSAQYAVPMLIALGIITEFSRPASNPNNFPCVYNIGITILFSLLTVTLIGMCGWVVFLWDIDRLFYRLERKIDAQTAAANEAREEPDGSMLGRARELINERVMRVRAHAVTTIEKAYWQSINEGGILAFPRPDISAAIEHIDDSRRDLLAPLTDYVAGMLPLGQAPAGIIARMIFRTIAPEVKVRLYRRLVLRFLAQLGALFVLTALCFYLSILGWSRVAPTVFVHADASAGGMLLYQLDLMLHGALFDFMEHTQRSVSPIRINPTATAFLYYTLLFRIFVSVYVISSGVRVIRFVARRWRALLRA
jgi:hypothetical protein